MRNKHDDKFLRLLRDLIKNMIFILALTIVFTTFIFRPIHVEGLSMYPTLDDNEYGFSNVISLSMSEIQRFDVVIVYLESRNKNIVKRVIGMPGETIEYRDDQLYVNGQAMDEPFLDTTYKDSWLKTNHGNFTRNFGPLVVPEGEYFTLGDNRPNSSDSRDYGTFKRNLIKSRNVFILLPFNKTRYEGR